MELVKRLILIKEKKKLSWDQLAKKLGVSRMTLYRWAEEKFSPHPIIQREIEKKLKRLEVK